MDQKLLDALNNLSDALEVISDALKDKKGAKAPTTQALQSGDFSKQITSIGVGIKSIKKDTQEILRQQKTILAISQKKESDSKSGVFDEAGDKKSESNLKKGVGAIVLIAVAVLAIGMAFKLVGKVDFLSVMALGIAIVLISVAFEKVAKLNITTKQALDVSKMLVIVSVAIALSSIALGMITPISFGQAITAILIAGMFSAIGFGISKILTALGESNLATLSKSILMLPIILPAIALGIAVSSWILKMVSPISFAQAITAILIAGMFTVIAFGISKILNALGESNLATLGKSIVTLPIILPAIALGIALSSWVLKLVTPISFAQAITAILIAATFAVISFGLKRLISAFDGVDEASLVAAAIMIPIMLPVLAFSIAVSSWALSMVKPISFPQFLTALAISVLFIALSFAVSIIVKSMENISSADIIKLPLLFVTLSIAVYVSSLILSKSTPIPDDKLFSCLKLGILLAVVSIFMAAAFWVMNKLNIGIKEAFLGSLVIVLVAATLMVSSLILSEGKYEKYPGLKWAIGVGASLLVFSIATLAIGAIIVLSGGMGAAAMLAGAAAVVLIAATMVETSAILNTGNYEKYPGLKWAMGVGISLLAFSIAAVVLGAVMLTGVGALALIAGRSAIIDIAETIVETAEILSKGNFTGGPSIAWATGVGLLISSFGIATMALGGFILGTLGLGGAALKKGSEAIKNIAQSIVDTAAILKSGDFTGGPTKKWAEGISLALGAFAPIYAMLMADGIMKAFGGGGVGPEDFAKAIRTISQGIFDSASLFKGTEGLFTGGPSKKWAEGVGTAISAFAPVFTMLMADGVLSLFGGGIDMNSMKSAIMTISEGIVDAAAFFKGKEGLFEEGSYPSETWGKNVGLALAAFSPVYEAIAGKSWYQSGAEAVEDLSSGVASMANSIVSVATSFSAPGVSWDMYPSETWSAGITATIKSFMDINDFLEDKEINDSVVRIAKKIKKVADVLAGGSFTNNIDPNFMKSMESNVFYYIELTKKLNESSGGARGAIKSALLGDPITNAAKGMVKLASAYDKLAASLLKFSTSINSLDPKKVNMFKDVSNSVLAMSGNQNSIVDTVGNAVSSVVSGVGNFLGSVFGGEKDESKPVGGDKGIAQKSGKTSKYGDMNDQLDVVIELLAKLNVSTKSLDVYLKEKMGQSSGSDVTSPSSSSSSGSWFNW